LCKLIWIRAMKEADKENEIVSATFMLSTVFLRETNDKLHGEKKGAIKKNLKNELECFEQIKFCMHVQEGECSSNASLSWSVLKDFFFSIAST